VISGNEVAKVYAGGVPVAEVFRSGFLESRHRGSMVVLDDAGAVLVAVGDPVGVVFPRSANKPMQAVAMLRAGLVLPEPSDLALVAASHSGEAWQVARVRELLSAGGLSEEDLRCPPDLPLSEPARIAVGGKLARAQMNCSGKHTGMLLTCRVNGWPTADYVDPDHPMQRACVAAIAELAGEPVGPIGVDGCGAVVAAISLTGLARAFLTVVEAEPGTAPRAVADAMRAFPEFVSGPGREDAKLMSAIPGLLTKTGAEGVYALALPGGGAVALKVDDGAGRAARPLLAAGLRRLGARADVLRDFAESPVLGGGSPVGSVQAAPGLATALRKRARAR
jgi:L-asparaginase II